MKSSDVTPAGVPSGRYEIAFEAFGVKVLVLLPNEEARERARTLLPPGWQDSPASAATPRFAIVGDDQRGFKLVGNDIESTPRMPLIQALDRLEARLRAYVALHAPHHVFVHAGVVAHQSKAIVLPGMSFSGKSTMVAALVQAGAVYYSDEFAVLDEQGLVHPYGKPLSLRNGWLEQVDHAIEALGGTSGEGPLRVGAIVVTSFRIDADWSPRKSSAGEGVMALLSNTIPARERPQEVMRTLTKAAEGVAVFYSERGDAADLAPRILQLVEG